MPFRFATMTAFLLLSSLLAAQKSTVQVLSDGKMDAWEKRNGNADYRLDSTGEGWEIVGIATPNSPNTFLATKKTYGDFILDLEVLVDSSLNSGIQIRSESKPDYNNGQVHGYQVEIDPSARAWSGGIYDEGRRGWLYPLTSNPNGRSAFHNGRWNQYHIEAIGHSIRTWINGIPCANLLDDWTGSGFIALQVHSIGNNTALAGKTVRWRNIRMRTGQLEDARWQSPAPELNLTPGTMSPAEKAAGWKWLFSGSLRDSLLSGTAGNFELVYDFAIGAGGAGKVAFPLPFPGPKGCAQLEIDLKLPENTLEQKLGVTLDNGQRAFQNLQTPVFRGADGWNRARVVVSGGRASYWLNEMPVGEKQFEPDWAGATAYCNALLFVRGNDKLKFRNGKYRALP